MRNIKIIAWEVQGFKSIALPMTFSLSEGITLLTGGNGIGKSTIIEALRWGLYGSDCKSSTKADIVTRPTLRRNGFEGTRVKVHFEFEGKRFALARHIDYTAQTFGVVGGNSLLLEEEGELLPDRSIATVQNRVENILGINADTFEVLVALPQYGDSFMTMTNSRKQNLINLLFDFSWVDAAQESAKAGLKHIQSQIFSAQQLLNSATNKLAVIEGKRVASEQSKANFEAQKIKRLATIKASIEEWECQKAQSIK